MAEQIPVAELIVLAGEAHQPFQERPAGFNALVDRFWSNLEGRVEMEAATAKIHLTAASRSTR